MMLANANNFYRKSGVAQWRDLRFYFSSHADSTVGQQKRPDLFGRILAKAINKLHRQKASCSADLDSPG
jgi:hypothetical protein